MFHGIAWLHQGTQHAHICRLETHKKLLVSHILDVRSKKRDVDPNSTIKSDSWQLSVVSAIVIKIHNSHIRSLWGDSWQFSSGKRCCLVSHLSGRQKIALVHYDGSSRWLVTGISRLWDSHSYWGLSSMAISGTD